MIPCFSILWISCSNLSFTDMGTCLAGFFTGIASSDNWIFTGSTGNLLTPENIDLNLGPLSRIYLLRKVPFFSSQLSNSNNVWSSSYESDILQLKLTRFNHITSGRPRIGLHLFGTIKNRQVYGKLHWEW